MYVSRNFACCMMLAGIGLWVAGCDEKSVAQAMRGLGLSEPVVGGITGTSSPTGPDQSAGQVSLSNDKKGDTNGNDNGGNGNANTNGNDNTGNGNANTDTNGNDNTGNGNTNTNTNTNDNTSGGTCPDGSTRLEGSIDAPVELEAEYRLLPAGCARFRVKVRDYAAGNYDILINGVVEGAMVVGGDGRGERELDTEDGTFPADFPLMMIGDVVQVGTHSVTMFNDCSMDDVDNCNGNGNTNTNGNTNSNDNMDDNSNDNSGFGSFNDNG